MTNKKQNGFIDCSKLNGKVSLYRPKPTKLNLIIGSIIIVYAVLPLFSLWALPIGLFIAGSPFNLLLLLKNKLKRKGL